MEPSKEHKSALLWLDLEMTGLDYERDRILEIATVVTTPDLQVVAEGPNLAIHQPREVLDAMSQWCRDTHGASGLTKRCLESDLDVAEAERQTLEFAARHLEPNTAPMCGNSICTDRRFLSRHMPRLEAFFHYQQLDVSSVRILASHWAPQALQGGRGEAAHLALDDVYRSIEELAHYRKHLFGLEAAK